MVELPMLRASILSAVKTYVLFTAIACGTLAAPLIATMHVLIAISWVHQPEQVCRHPGMLNPSKQPATCSIVQGLQPNAPPQESTDGLGALRMKPV